MDSRERERRAEAEAEAMTMTVAVTVTVTVTVREAPHIFEEGRQRALRGVRVLDPLRDGLLLSTHRDAEDWTGRESGPGRQTDRERVRQTD